MSRSLFGLAHPVAARLKLLQYAVAILVGRDGARDIREPRVAVHGVHRALHGVERIAPAHLLVGSDLQKVDLAIGGVLEREDQLVSRARVEHERLEVRGDLALHARDLATGRIVVAHRARRVEADNVVAAPFLEGLVAPVERVAAVAGERV